MFQTQAAPMPKPERPRRDDKAVKIDRRIAERAHIIARTRGQSAAEYLSELLRPLVDRDWPRALKKLDSSGPARTEDE